MKTTDGKTSYRNVLAIILAVAMIPAMAIDFAGCSSGEAGDTEATTETIEETEALIPTKDIQYDENGELTPESKEMLVEQQRDEEAQKAWEEYQDSLAREEMKKWDEGDPGHQGLPGGH